MEKLVIRPIDPSEFDEVYSLIRTAFETAKVKDGDEQDFADGLRLRPGYVPQLDMVAQYGGRIVGHIMLTETIVEMPDGSVFTGLLVAPVSVLIEYRDKGIGGAMILRALEKARSLGYKAAFLVGDPAYYGRFGFVSTDRFGIRPKDEIPARFVQGIELVETALDGVSGVLYCC